jgi:hypothetical protein
MTAAERTRAGFAAIALALAAVSVPAVGQDRLERRTKPLDITIDGVPLRVPGKYAHGPNIPIGAIKFGFSFWISDGEPVSGGVPEIGATDRVGAAIYWPREAGRPPVGRQDDFLVLVHDVAFVAGKKEINRQQWRRERVGGGIGSNKVENGLECRAYPIGSKDCVTPLGYDPDVVMELRPMSGNSTWRAYIHSSVDPLWADLSFPELGQSRWPEAVCRTLQLIRSWRLSGGPPPPDCSKAARLSSVIAHGT